MGVGAVLAAWLLLHTSLGVLPVVAITVLCCAVLGAINGFVVVVMKIDSFIGTLATGSLMQALILIITDNRSITGAELSGDFGQIARISLGGLTLPVLYMLLAALAIWYLLEQTMSGWLRARLTVAGETPAAWATS